jgi:hypothetical protein
VGNDQVEILDWPMVLTAGEVGHVGGGALWLEGLRKMMGWNEDD